MVFDRYSILSRYYSESVSYTHLDVYKRQGLRHRLFTAVTRVRIPYGLWYVAVEALDEKKFQKNFKKVLTSESDCDILI